VRGSALKGLVKVPEKRFYVDTVRSGPVFKGFSIRTQASETVHTVFFKDLDGIRVLSENIIPYG
jgi:hypothetical protein